MPRQQQGQDPSTPRAGSTGRRSYDSGTSSAADLEFDLDGVTFRPVGVPTLDMFEMAAVAGLDPDQAMSKMDAESLQMVARLWKTVFGFEHDGGREYNRFKAHTARHGTKLAVLMRILSDLLADSGKEQGLPVSPSAGGPSTNVLPLSGHWRRSQQPPAEAAGGDREVVSPFTPAEQRAIAIRKAGEREELRQMGFPDNWASGTG
jgi:hypothetical protein